MAYGKANEIRLLVVINSGGVFQFRQPRQDPEERSIRDGRFPEIG